MEKRETVKIGDMEVYKEDLEWMKMWFDKIDPKLHYDNFGEFIKTAVREYLFQRGLLG